MPTPSFQPSCGWASAFMLRDPVGGPNHKGRLTRARVAAPDSLDELTQSVALLVVEDVPGEVSAAVGHDLIEGEGAVGLTLRGDLVERLLDQGALACEYPRPVGGRDDRAEEAPVGASNGD